MYASVGQVAINKIPLTTSQAIFSMTITDKVILDFLYYYLSYFKEKKLHRYLETGTQSNINADFIKGIAIPDYGYYKNKLIISLLSLMDEKIKKENCAIAREGKNWYATVDGQIFTVNAYSYTIITAHRCK